MFVVTVTSKPTMQEDEDGRRWIVVIAAFFVQFIICGISYSIGVFQIVFQDVFSIDYFDTSWAGSIQLYTTALTSKFLSFPKPYKAAVFLDHLLQNSQEPKAIM